MRKKLAMCTMATLALITIACGDSTPTSPDSNGVTPSFSRGGATRNLGALVQHGWACMAIPALGVHCFPPGAFAAPASLPILVFEGDDPSATDAAFLGTELLIRADLYAGQPCPAEGGEYALLPAAETGLPADYRACHHYTHGD